MKWLVSLNKTRCHRKGERDREKKHSHSKQSQLHSIWQTGSLDDNPSKNKTKQTDIKVNV